MSHRILPRSFFGIRFRAPVRAVRPFAQEARGHTPAGSTSTSSSSGSKSFDDAKLDKGFKERVKAMNPSGTDENQQSGAHGAGDGFGKGSGSPAAKFAPQSNLHETAGSSTSTASSSSAAAGAFKQGGNASGSLGASGSYGLGLGDQNLPKGSVMGAGEWGSQAQAGNKNTKQGLGATERDASLGFKVAGSEQSSHQASGLGRSPSAGSTQGLGQGGIGGSSSTTSGSGADRSWYENKMKRDRGDHTAPSFSPASSSSSSSSSSSADFNSVNKTASSGPSNTNLPHGLGYNQSASELGGAYGTKRTTSASSGMNRNPSATDANSSWSSQQSGAKSSQSAYQSAPMSQSSGFGYGNHASGSAAQSSTASTSTATSTSDMVADAKNLAEKLREKGHELKDKIKDKIGKVMKSDDDAPRSGRGQ